MVMNGAPLSHVASDTAAQAPAAALNGVAPLPRLGVIGVQGDDAAKFLHGLLSQDFLHLGATEARLAALCSPKGRMQASFIALRHGTGEILLVCSRDLLPATLKRLALFVLRAKVHLRDASDALALFGADGDAIDSRADSVDKPWAVAAFGNEFWVGLYPADGQPRALRIAPAGAAAPPGAPLGLGLEQPGGRLAGRLEGKEWSCTAFREPQREPPGPLRRGVRVDELRLCRCAS